MSRSKKTAPAVEGGKRVPMTREGLWVLAATAVACLLPILLGMRLYDSLPAIVPTNIIGQSGKDDSIPRTVVVFGIPVLMCLLDVLAHYQINTDPKRVYGPAFIRGLCGWGFPALSVWAAAVFMLESAGQTVGMLFYTPLAIGLLLMLGGSLLVKARQGSPFALKPSSGKGTEATRENRMAGLIWLGLGLVVLAGAMLGQATVWITGGAALLALLAALLCAKR